MKFFKFSIFLLFSVLVSPGLLQAQISNTIKLKLNEVDRLINQNNKLSVLDYSQKSNILKSLNYTLSILNDVRNTRCNGLRQDDKIFYSEQGMKKMAKLLSDPTPDCKVEVEFFHGYIEESRQDGVYTIDVSDVLLFSTNRNDRLAPLIAAVCNGFRVGDTVKWYESSSGIWKTAKLLSLTSNCKAELSFIIPETSQIYFGSVKNAVKVN